MSIRKRRTDGARPRQALALRRAGLKLLAIANRMGRVDNSMTPISLPAAAALIRLGLALEIETETGGRPSDVVVGSRYVQLTGDVRAARRVR